MLGPSRVPLVKRAFMAAINFSTASVASAPWLKCSTAARMRSHSVRANVARFSSAFWPSCTWTNEFRISEGSTLPPVRVIVLIRCGASCMLLRMRRAPSKSNALSSIASMSLSSSSSSPSLSATPANSSSSSSASSDFQAPGESGWRCSSAQISASFSAAASSPTMLTPLLSPASSKAFDGDVPSCIPNMASTTCALSLAPAPLANLLRCLLLPLSVALFLLGPALKVLSHCCNTLISLTCFSCNCCKMPDKLSDTPSSRSFSPSSNF
mmetsp:Transcript_57808/g.167464  ORF Transcript_57808/g.167464 Transcript_57808/m.167464 type:complete len:268 (+) Transcript_57808:2853-3656(+)